MIGSREFPGASYDAWKTTPDDHYDEQDDTCPNCGGEGVVYSCFEEFACIDPEGGCDDCERRCDWCRPSRKSERDPDAERDRRLDDAIQEREFGGES